MKFRKKPIIIEAIKWTGKNWDKIYKFSSGKINTSLFYFLDCNLYIKTSEGDMKVNIGDWIIKEPFDKKRKFYPCQSIIFEATYEKVKD